jgi:hypothetical protein
LLFSLPQATPPQFFWACVEKHRGNASAFDQHRILLPHKGTASEGYDSFSAGSQLIHQFLQSGMFCAAERWLAGITEDFMNLTSFTPLNSVVEIFKRPAQVLAQSPAYTAFAGAHEADQDQSQRLRSSLASRKLAATHIGPRRFGRALSRPFARIRFSLRFLYLFSERFLR